MSRLTSTFTWSWTITPPTNTAFDNLTISSIETLTITAQEATATSTVYQHSLNLTETGLTTLNIAGTEKVDLDGAAISVTTVTVTATGGAAVDNSSAGVDTTFTGGSGADEYTGAAGNDTISAGGGADYVFGGVGADSITGGDGSDIIVGGAGNDAIILTEDTPSTDYVAVVNQTAATNVDTLTGFTRGSSSGFDVLDLDSGLLVVGTSAIISGTAAASALVAANVRLETAAGTLNTEMSGVSNEATDRVMVLNSQAYSSASLAEFATDTLASATNAINAAGYVVWTDGTDIYVSSDSDLDTSGTTMYNVARFAGGLTELRELSLSNFSTGMLRGGAFADSLTSTTSFADIIIGGAGNDTFVFSVDSGVPTASSTASSLDAITDFVAGADSVSIADTDGTPITIALATNDTVADTTAATVDVLNTSGVLTSITVGLGGGAASAYTTGTGGSAATDTIAEVLAILDADLGTDGNVILFDFDADMYLWMQNGAADLVVKFTGLQGVTALTDTSDIFTFA